MTDIDNLAQKRAFFIKFFGCNQQGALEYILSNIFVKNYCIGLLKFFSLQVFIKKNRKSLFPVQIHYNNKSSINKK